MKRHIIAYERGRWYAPRRKGFLLVCCDCGLAHIVDLRIRDHRIQWRFRRDNRTTANVRRRKSGHRCKKRPWLGGHRYA